MEWLLQSPFALWLAIGGALLALEVGTDGLWSHIDRDIKIPQIEQEIETRLARAFKVWSERV